MAAAGRRTVAPGQNIASDWGNVVWDQSVQRFDTAAQRASQWAAPTEGALSWLDDSKALQMYRGGAWGSVARSWIFPRAADGQYPPAQEVGLIQGTVTAAPPGLYLITGRLIVRSLANINAGANMRIRRSLDTSGPILTESIADVPAVSAIRANHVVTTTLVWGGGDLSLCLSHSVGSDTTTLTALGSYVSVVQLA
jgi:hypothetical protein